PALGTGGRPGRPGETALRTGGTYRNIRSASHDAPPRSPGLVIPGAPMPFSLDAKMVLLGALAILTLFYIALLVTATGRKRREAGRSVAPDALALGTGFFTNFLDTLGIGSYATTTSIFRFFKMVPDERIPGTL